MLKLIHATVVRNEEHCIENMLESVLPYVDESYVLVDDRTTDRTKEILEDYGCNIALGHFVNFSKFGNTLRKWISDKSDWYFGLAADETISSEFGQSLRPLIEKAHNSDVDCFRFRRKHWMDLYMNEEYTKQNWYPDWQSRLYRNDYPRIHLKNYVHEWPVGIRDIVNVELDINHFNMYWKPRIAYNFEEMNKLYEELKRKQRIDGGKDIWPD